MKAAAGVRLIAMGWALAGAVPESQAAEATAPAKAGPIVVDTAAAWTHGPTGIVLPAAIGAFTRTEVSQSDHGLADVSISYQDNVSRTALTVYVFRAGWPQAPLWADRLSQVMAMSAQRNGGTLAGPPSFAAFAPTGHVNASALRVVQAVQGGQWQATGAVVIPYGPWLVTMRMSSATLDAKVLDAQLTAAAAALQVPAPAQPLPAAVPIIACTDTLTLKPAKHVGPSKSSNSLIDALLGAALAQSQGAADEAESKGDATSEPPPYVATLCRDPSSSIDHGVYRAPGDMQRYVIALGDAGITLAVGPNTLSALLDKRLTYSATLTMFDKVMVYPAYASLPPPDQAIAALDREHPQSETSDGKSITIHP